MVAVLSNLICYVTFGLLSMFRYIPNPLSLIKMPSRENAPILKANTPNGRWPVMIFSHGLSGTRTTYSFLASSLASHGIIIVTPEHRDGSAPISFIHTSSPESINPKNQKNAPVTQSVDYIHLPHVLSPEVEARRNSQLKIRLMELNLICESLFKINEGISATHLKNFSVLNTFKMMMDVNTPGKIIFAGHSFGAATIAQFIKSTFHASIAHQVSPDQEVLFKPSPNASITKQISPDTPVVLLDVWCLPLRTKATQWLWNRPFPSYSNQSLPGGDVLLAIESQTFYKWSDNLTLTKQLLSPDPSFSTPDFEKIDKTEWSKPYFYYLEDSTHISPSDFGLLAPYFVNKILGCEEPERLMRIQVRAIVQFLRYQNINISSASAKEKEASHDEKQNTVLSDENCILGNDHQVKGWNRISMYPDNQSSKNVPESK